MKNKLTLLHLSLIDGIGPITIKKMAEKKPAGFCWSDLYQLRSSDIAHRFDLTQWVAQKISVGLSDTKTLETECRLIEKHKISFATIGSDDYPHMLAEIHAPPPVLYWIGQPVFHEQKTMAVIGSRKAHRYGQQAIEHLVPELVRQKWVIVSGGAIGADSMAHSQTLKSGGKTVVVLGAGLLRLYPASNKRLFDSIVSNGGALVSAFPLMTEARPGNFPARNRIISGLSRGCIVVQAAAKSGARITAQFALEQGREVFAVPGPIGDELSAGCHALIQQGAKLINSAEDIFVEFPSFSHGGVGETKIPKIFQGQLSGQSLIIPARKSQKVEPVKGPSGQVLHLCTAPTSTDDLVLKVGLEIEKLQELLFDLQLAGDLKQNFAGLWERA